MANTEQALNKAREALELASAICDAVPNRAHELEDSPLAHLGKLVNCQPDGTHGYRVIHDALHAVKAASAEAAQPVAWRKAMMDMRRVLRCVEAGDDSQWKFISNVCANADDVLAAPQAGQPIGQTAEDYLREKYGAYRGHHAWRELEDAFNAGKVSNSQPVSGAELTDETIIQTVREIVEREGYDVQDDHQANLVEQVSIEVVRALLSASGQASQSEQITSLKFRKRELETEVSDLRNTLNALRASQSEKAVRDAALEEAAKICDTHRHGSSNYAATCSLQIRALLSTPAQQTEEKKGGAA